jgi:hypothetical protein
VNSDRKRTGSSWIEAQSRWKIDMLRTSKCRIRHVLCRRVADEGVCQFSKRSTPVCTTQFPSPPPILRHCTPASAFSTCRIMFSATMTSSSIRRYFGWSAEMRFLFRSQADSTGDSVRRADHGIKPDVPGPAPVRRGSGNRRGESLRDPSA